MARRLEQDLNQNLPYLFANKNHRNFAPSTLGFRIIWDRWGGVKRAGPGLKEPGRS